MPRHRDSRGYRSRVPGTREELDRAFPERAGQRVPLDPSRFELPECSRCGEPVVDGECLCGVQVVNRGGR